MALALLIWLPIPRCHRNILRPGVKNLLGNGKSMVKHVVSESMRFGSHEPLDFIKNNPKIPRVLRNPTCKIMRSHGSLNVPIEHHPTIRYMVHNGYDKVMSNIPKMGQLPTPSCRHLPASLVTSKSPKSPTTAGLLCQLPASVQLPRIL